VASRILSEEDGMKNLCSVNLHNAVTVSQHRLGKRVAQIHFKRWNWFRIALTTSFMIAFFSWMLPNQWRPVPIDAIMWICTPLAVLWLVLLRIAIHYFRLRALWIVLGAPAALYWPLWLLWNGIPGCYWNAGCARFLHRPKSPHP
jgi:hypothetical protein